MESKIQELLKYTDELWRLAFSKCGNTDDADELVQETYLAALEILNRGKIIEYPKTWLANTLMHIRNSKLRKKYRTPTTLSLDFEPPFNDSLYTSFEKNDSEPLEYVNLRKTVASLTLIYRQAVVMHYIGGLSISEIAKQLGVPEGTVKRRLYDGREKMKNEIEKEQDTSREMSDFTPMRVSLSWNGRLNDKRIITFAQKNIVQEILVCAYKSPLTLTEISEKIGIPIYYIEDLVEEAVELEVMVKIGNKYAADALLDYPEDIEHRENLIEKFASNHRDSFATLHAEINAAVDEIYSKDIPQHIRTKLKRFFFIEALQFMNLSMQSGDNETFERPRRKDGGNWILMGTAYPLGWNWNNKYPLGGHRISGREKFTLHEFDTTLFDTLGRYMYLNWIDHESALIYSVYRGINPLDMGVPPKMIEQMPHFCHFGVFTDDIKVDIPVLDKSEYTALEEKCHEMSAKLADELKENFARHAEEVKVTPPAHIPKTTVSYASTKPIDRFEMAVCCDLYNAGIHLKDVDYCCPPMVLVLE